MHIKSGALYSEWPNSPGARLQALAYLHTAVPSDHRSALLSFARRNEFFFQFFLGDPLNTRLTDMWQIHNSSHGLRGLAVCLRSSPSATRACLHLAGFPNVMKFKSLEKAHRTMGITVVVQNDVPTTDLSKNGNLKKGRPERAGKPMSSAKPWRTLRRRCQLDLVARTPTIKSSTVSSFFRTPPEACGHFRQITTSPVRLNYSLP